MRFAAGKAKHKQAGTGKHFWRAASFVEPSADGAFGRAQVPGSEDAFADINRLAKQKELCMQLSPPGGERRARHWVSLAQTPLQYVVLKFCNCDKSPSSGG